MPVTSFCRAVFRDHGSKRDYTKWPSHRTATVRENLHHASIATTSIYLQSDEVKRARQTNQAFAARSSEVRVRHASTA